MRRKKVPSRRWLLRLQSLSCLLLIFLMLFMSFGSLYSVEVKATREVKMTIDDMVDLLNEIAVEKVEQTEPTMPDDTDTASEELDETETSAQKVKIVLPERVNVNLYMFIKMLFKLDDVSRVLNGALELYSSMGDIENYNQTLENLYTTMSEARALVTSDEFVNLLALVVTVMHEYGESSFAGTGMIIMILMTVFLPLALWTLISIMLVGTLITVWNAERWYFWMNKCFKAALRIFTVVLAVLLFSGTINLGWGLIISFIACVLGIVIASLFSRLKSRTREGIKYINVLHIASAVKLVGFVVFFLCFAKTNLVGQFVGVIFTDVLKNIFSQDYGTVFLKQFLFTIIAFAAIIALFASFATFIGTLSRAGGMQKRNKESCMFSTVMCAVLILAPIIVSTFYSGVSIANANMGYVFGSFIGILIMILSEIAIPVCRKYFCRDLKETEKDAILRGLETVETEYFYADDE